MKRPLILAALFLIAFPALSAIKTLNSQEAIKASDINHNFSEIESQLAQKNTPIIFHSFESGDLIDKDSFEVEFNKVRGLGISVPEIQEEKIMAEELNNIFAQMLSGVSSYDDVPLASNISFSTSEDSNYLVPFVYTNNVGPSQIQIVNAPLHGTMIPSGNGYIYSPSLNYFGTDSFTYRVFDGVHSSSVASASVNIIPVNDAPVATSQSLSLNEDGSLNIILSGSDAENSSLTFELTSVPLHGTLTGSGATRTYIPSTNYNGVDSFSFKVNDGQLDSLPATVTLTINPVNDLPSLTGSQLLTVNQNSPMTGAVSATDVDDTQFTYSVAVSPLKGSVVFGSNGTYTYTPSLNAYGVDSFSVRANDGKGFSDNFLINVNIIGSGIVATNGVKHYMDGSFADSCNQYKNQSSGNYTYTGNTGSGTYRIKPSSSVATTYDVYCDMVSEGGGWTRVNSQISSPLVGSFNASEQMVVTNLPSTNCNPGPMSMRVSNVKVPFSKIRLDFTRHSTIVQCANISRLNTASSIIYSSGYVDSVNLVEWSTCTWNDNVWAKAQGTLNITGLRTNWRLLANKDPDSTGFAFYSTCSYAADNSQITATWFVR